MNTKWLYLIIIILVIVVIIFIVRRDDVLGNPHEITTKKLFEEVKIMSLPQIPVSEQIHIQNARAFNPSLVTLNNKPLFVYRISNCTNCQKTRNVQDDYYVQNNRLGSYVALQYGRQVLNLITPNISHSSCIQGFEDPRPILSPDGQMLYIVVNNRTTEKCVSQMWLMKVPTSQILQSFGTAGSGDMILSHENLLALEKEGGDEDRAEKNWMPFFHGNDLMFVYSVNPHIILQCNLGSGLCSVIAMTANENLPPKLRGSSQVRLYNNRYIGVTHVQKGHHSYVSQLYAFKAEYPFNVTAISQEFIFDDKEEFKSTFIQFVAGLDIINDVAYITYGEHDCDSKLCTVPMVDLEKILYDVPPSQSALLRGD